jgi:hypothetical protein
MLIYIGIEKDTSSSLKNILGQHSIDPYTGATDLLAFTATVVCAKLKTMGCCIKIILSLQIIIIILHRAYM